MIKPAISNKMFDLFYTNEELSQQMDGYETQINLDYTILKEFDSDYADLFLKKPENETKTLGKAASGFADRELEIQIYNLPLKNKIRDLNKKNIGKLVEVKGVVVLRTVKVARPTVLNYICPVCGKDNPVVQDEQWRIIPAQCCAPSCDNRKGFKKDYTNTEYDDYQWIEIQETVDDVDNGRSAAKIRVLLRNHRVDSCLPGETVTVVGLYKTTEKSPNTLHLEMNTYIEAVTIINDTEASTTVLTDEDIAYVKQLMKEPDYLKNIIKSIAPSIYGLEHVKEALAYQMCEGQVRWFGKTRRRGQFHILLAGSPGCGKSEMLDFMVLCHPKGMKAIGRGSSGVGLTAAVVKEGETFVLKAGAMPLSDNGFLGIDEIEKMNSNDSGAMHPGMEQQKIKINKADISAELNTRCSILAACNPIDGFWNDYKTTPENLHEANKGLPLPLIDRFALTFIFRQNKNSEDERKVIQHIMMANSNPDSLNPPYTIDVLRKIFAYARTLQVKTTVDVAKVLEDFCMVLFDASALDDSLMITRRQPPDLTRITEASTRLHGRTETTIEDAENAKRVVASSLENTLIDPTTGKLNQSVMLYGAKRSKLQMLKDIPIVIKRLGKRKLEEQDRISEVELTEYLSMSWKIPESEAEQMIGVLKKDGTLFTPSRGMVAVTP